MKTEPYFMRNKDWYYFDEAEFCYKLTEKAPPEAVQSYDDFYKEKIVKDKSGNVWFQTMNPLKRFLGDTSSEQFRVYDTSDEAEKHVSIFGVEDATITEDDIKNLREGKTLVCEIMNEYSIMMRLENNENHT